ncbi:MAG: DUF3365 domain-containing protein, partial [Gammaproteobacteria bacterium]|nr:DUF3365 domain-containing protein [Gammaproteobacteria bacterium]
MSFSRQIQLTIGTITVLAITLLGGYTYHTTTLDIQTQHLRESDAIYNFLMAVRRVGQRQFIESGIPLTDKTVGFLPAHSLPAVSKEFTKNWDTRGIEIRTSSDRPRNPNNRANPNEQIALNWFRNNDEEEIFTTIIRDNFFYARPLWIVNSCLKCHGEQASAPPTIRDSYSSAYDYKVGELRGIVSITTPIEGIDRKILAAFLPKALFLLISGLLSALLINHFLQRFLNQREVAEAELQQTQKQLEKENQHTQAIMASMNEGVVVINPEGTIQQVNPKLEQLTGRTEAALLHQPIDSLFVEAELFQTQLLSMQGGHDGKGKTGRLSSDLSLLNQSGEVTPVHLSGSLLQQTGHSFEGTVLIVHDISTRLRDSEERFRAITQSTNEGIISIDSQGGVIFWNRGAERIFG